MSNIFRAGLLVPFIILLGGCAHDDQGYRQEISSWQQDLNEMFSDTARSPLPDSMVTEFQGLEFFPADENYRVEAEFVLTPDAEPFQMPTTTSRLVWYKKFGEASFMLNGEDLILAIYQNQELIENEKYKDHLFLPYKDHTNGVETYGGGRYIDLKIPAGERIIIDFNRSYNPYCAYNHRYSCPIPPEENHLKTGIRAGVLAWEH